MSAFGEQVTVLQRQEQVQRDLEHCADDMDRCRALPIRFISGPHMTLPPLPLPAVIISSQVGTLLKKSIGTHS